MNFLKSRLTPINGPSGADNPKAENMTSMITDGKNWQSG